MRRLFAIVLIPFATSMAVAKPCESVDPTADGSRPGIFYINTFNLKAQPIFGMETLSLLGSRFDVKKFHRVLLIDGPLPMSVLGTQVRDWVARENLTLAHRPRNGTR